MGVSGPVARFLPADQRGPEDDPARRRHELVSATLAALLERSRYEVLVAAHGEAALPSQPPRDGAIDVVVNDMVRAYRKAAGGVVIGRELIARAW